MFVAELGHRNSISQGMSQPTPASPPSRVSVVSLSGELLARWGGDDPCSPDGFFAAHGLAVESQGDLIVCEVIPSAGRGQAPSGCHGLRKYVRL